MPGRVETSFSSNAEELGGPGQCLTSRAHTQLDRVLPEPPRRIRDIIM